jgi:hypothetical protein
MAVTWPVASVFWIGRVQGCVASRHTTLVSSRCASWLSHVSIHNLCTVAPRQGELLALLIYLTGLLHVGPGFKTCLVPLSFG